ncbi:MAG TPA: hypothetical protein PK040_05015 [Anaerolineaceae bacterium]|nr:hypothetical protein [Anaerolineaceae bacterium]
MTKDESKLEILKKVEDGTLSVEEGADLIGILERAAVRAAKQPLEPEEAAPAEPAPAQIPQVSSCWKAAWSMILVGGLVLTGFSIWWMYLGYQKSGPGWGFWLSWIPLLIGLVFLVFGIILMESPWMHLRVHEHGKGKSVNLVMSIPLPLQLAGWVFRTFGSYMPAEVRGMDIGSMVDEIEASLKRGEPFQVEIEDKEDGDQVYVYVTK